MKLLKHNEITNNNLESQVSNNAILLFKVQKKKKKKKKNTKNINPRISKTSNGTTMLLSECAICLSKKSMFIKKQEAKGFLSNMGLKTPLSKIPILSDVLSCFAVFH